MKFELIFHNFFLLPNIFGILILHVDMFCLFRLLLGINFVQSDQCWFLFSNWQTAAQCRLPRAQAWSAHWYSFKADTTILEMCQKLD